MLSQSWCNHFLTMNCKYQNWRTVCLGSNPATFKLVYTLSAHGVDTYGPFANCSPHSTPKHGERNPKLYGLSPLNSPEIECDPACYYLHHGGRRQPMLMLRCVTVILFNLCKEWGWMARTMMSSHLVWRTNRPRYHSRRGKTILRKGTLPWDVGEPRGRFLARRTTILLSSRGNW